MHHTFTYQTTTIEKTIHLDIPDTLSVETIDPSTSTTPPPADITLSITIDPHKRTLIIVNDGQRPTPTARILALLSDSITTNENCFFIIATGSHRAPTPQEMLDIFGADLYPHIKERVIIHDAKESPCVYIGKSERGTDVYMNAAAQGYDHIITIGSVEPHYFAGYTGGRKSFVPGISAYSTIEHNHSLSFSSHSRLLALDTNPLHLDLNECTSLIVDYLHENFNTQITAINAVVIDDNIHMIHTGDIEGGMNETLDIANTLFVKQISAKKDIAVAVAEYPMNKVLYQALKAFENCRYAINEGGIIILVAECDMGKGPTHFTDIIDSTKMPQELYDEMKADFKLGAQKLKGFAEFLSGGGKIYIVSSLDDVGKNFFTAFSTLQDAFDDAVQQYHIDHRQNNREPDILLINDAATVVTEVKEHS